MKRFSSITTTQLARICGVSQGTVDRALHGREGIKEETRAKILAVAKEYDYVPRRLGASVENGRSMLIGVVLFDLYNEFFSKLAMSLVNQAKRVGYSVIFLFSNKNIKSEKSAIDYFNYIGVDGIVLFSVGSDDQEYANYLQSLMKPLILIGNRVLDLPYIGLNDYKAMYDLAYRFGENTKDEIVYFAPILAKKLSKTNAQKLRVKGFIKAMNELGRDYKIAVKVEDIEEADNIICSTDHYLLQVLKKFRDRNDKKLAGFDNIKFLQSLGMKVLTVDYSTDHIAIECLKYLIGRKYSKKIDYDIVYNL